MNKFFFFASIVLISVNSFSQPNYYWSGGKKIELTIDSSRFIMFPKDINFNNDDLRSTQGVKNYQRLRSNYILIELIENITLSSVEVTGKISSRNLAYSFKTIDGARMIPTGEILVLPKKGIAIETIISRSNASLSIQDKNKYGEYKLRVEGNFNILSVSNLIYESGLVQFAHPNFIADIVKFQNDLLYPDQYYLNNTGQFGGTIGVDINAPQAWALSNGLNNIRVAVIDDGVENHEDINGRVLAGFTPTNPNGFGAPIAGGNHGQQCAGIIAATSNNVLGIAGIAQCSQIIPINIFTGGEDIQDLVDAIDFAWDDAQADVISNSWGFTGQNVQIDAIAQAITRARTQGRGNLGSIVVFASGNSHPTSTCTTNQGCFNGVTFPANVDGVVTVGAINRNGNIWNYSSRGAQMDLVAPSGNVNNNGDVRTTDRMGNNGLVAGNYINTFGGTSAAAPQVSGVAALMLSINPALTEAQVVNILRNTATDMGGAGFDNTFGFGRLNAQAAIQQVVPTLSGSGLICTNTNTVTLSFIPQNTTVTWQVTPANLFVTASGNGATANLQAVNSSVSGAAIVTFTIQGNCRNMQLTQALWVGAPTITYNPTPPGLNPCSTNPYYSAPIVSASYQWQVSNPNIWIIPPDNMWNVVTLSSEAEYFEITVSMSGGNCFATNTLTNQYGNALYCECFYDPWQCPGQGGGWGLFSVYPNPADNYMEVQIDDTEFNSSSFSSFEIVMLDNNGTELFRSTTNDKSKRIDTSSIKNGQYFLHVMYKGEILKRQVFVNK